MKVRDYFDTVTIYIWSLEPILMVRSVDHVIVKTPMFVIWPILLHLLFEGICITLITSHSNKGLSELKLSHGTGLWKLNQNEGKLDFVMELPGCGDTAFASWVRLSEHKFLVANYTSPISRCEYWSWLQGQISPLGTGIYFVVLDFTPK